MAFTHFQNYELCWIKNLTCMLWNIIVSWTWYRLDRWNVMANDKSMVQPQLFIIWVIFHFHRCWLCVMNFQYIKVVCWGCKCADQRGEQHTPLHSLVCIITPVCSSQHQPCPEHFLQMAETIHNPHSAGPELDESSGSTSNL